ncbi:MAG: type II toxin-antitoxin system VapB family antitoxin [Eggerthellaceae bacterium]|nr:type II toxin-antitoxin system VapB family antitoxin [Eggerthellaceae bacterium]
MRTTVLLDDELVEKAKQFTGLAKTSQVINAVLDDYVRRASQLRLVALGGSYKEAELSMPPRKRLP